MLQPDPTTGLGLEPSGQAKRGEKDMAKISGGRICSHKEDIGRYKSQ